MDECRAAALPDAHAHAQAHPTAADGRASSPHAAAAPEPGPCCPLKRRAPPPLAPPLAPPPAPPPPAPPPPAPPPPALPPPAPVAHLHPPPPVAPVGSVLPIASLDSQPQSPEAAAPIFTRLVVGVAVVGALGVAAYYTMRCWRAPGDFWQGGGGRAKVTGINLAVAPLTLGSMPKAVEMGELRARTDPTPTPGPWNRLEEE